MWNETQHHLFLYNLLCFKDFFFGSINTLDLLALKDQKLLLTESWKVIISQFKESLNIPPMLVI